MKCWIDMHEHTVYAKNCSLVEKNGARASESQCEKKNESEAEDDMKYEE